MRPRWEKCVSMRTPRIKSMPGPRSTEPKRGLVSELPLMNIEFDIMAAPALVAAGEEDARGPLDRLDARLGLRVLALRDIHHDHVVYAEFLKDLPVLRAALLREFGRDRHHRDARPG